MMKVRVWGALDWLAHFLYCPAMLGRRCARTTWLHRIRLIPTSWLAFVCDRYDLALGVEPDELHRSA